ncbi:threonine-phosphate decarboxylase CobD [Paracoccus sp. P2]|uniref:threonine-phosphate decarboxylase n=1 Tax=Paracoccus pantotrophus TaxID=82367 RepID=A0A7H9BV14_PARPN|nr:threonine-phosphate decarboxylase CobD [Paracoccus pantotrophus]MDF3853400.1 threonine-phosphate decarboxylase CobD [Paracoccus pantotrophus]QLH14686.1 threonine-phosphate decarboxylase [Paracoccus pantotrophus]RDD98802.1 threonine-phosphate decarboxylase [Paracoccus pantotrophus]RNI18883.1 threonine-phosphate decarboxylase [Paracoccus pantotrophus]WGR64813.1 threonine-phosphate decarboxylase [Paracoccus pantotrophus]
MRDHGGDIDKAASRFGRADWIDLSTGINRRPWPAGPLSPHALTALPTRADAARLCAAAAARFGCPQDQVLPLAGASAAIQLLPQVLAGRRAAVLSPTYNEHAASLRAAGWEVAEPTDPAALEGADLAVIVNPNNPDGREFPPAQIAAIAATVGHLVVDESFADPRPDLSAAATRADNVTVLRSFGKFWGLAGLRLGFAIAAPDLLARLAERTGPWSVSGPALEIGAQALADAAWIDDTVVWLSEAALHLDQIVTPHWPLVGGTHLFRLYDTPDAQAAHERLARAGIWSRIFPWHPRWIRLGIPGNRAEFDRVAGAFTAPG